MVTTRPSGLSDAEWMRYQAMMEDPLVCEVAELLRRRLAPMKHITCLNVAAEVVDVIKSQSQM